MVHCQIQCVLGDHTINDGLSLFAYAMFGDTTRRHIGTGVRNFVKYAVQFGAPYRIVAQLLDATDDSVGNAQRVDTKGDINLVLNRASLRSCVGAVFQTQDVERYSQQEQKQ